MSNKGKKLVLGIDESGRGPIVGNLVLAGVLIEEGDEKELKDMGVKDSKLLSEKQRNRLFPKIEKLAKKVMVVEVTPAEIDARFAVGMNLNSLEASKMAEIINKLRPDIAIVDCPSPNIRSFKEKTLAKFLEHRCEVIAEHYADKNWPVVSAASIIAKVIRDKRIKEIEREVGYPIGVGYTHDQRTLDFVERALSEKDHLDKYIRKSWLTFKRIKDGKSQKRLSDEW
jgi:ribonuclease HII